MNVGYYVRTKDYLDNQLICKIDKIIDEYCINTDKGYWDNEHILKSSPNIIDLIEVGDYVNGGKVYEKEEGYIVINADFGRIFEFMNIYEKDIKSIVTKEQFESMEYKVGD